MKGFTLFLKRKDYFFVTDYKNKTKKLAKKVIYSLNGTGDFDIPDNAAGIDEILYNLYDILFCEDAYTHVCCKTKLLVDAIASYFS